MENLQVAEDGGGKAGVYRQYQSLNQFANVSGDQKEEKQSDM